MVGSVDLSAVMLAILVGGESRRMGLPKTHLRIEGRPIIQYLFDSLAWPGPTMLVTAPSQQDIPGEDLIQKKVLDFMAGQGPLCGILSALLNADTDIVVIITVDMPMIRLDALRWMLAQLAEEPGLDGMICQHPEADRNRIEPFPLAIRTRAALAVKELFQRGQRSVHGLLALPKFEARTVPPHWPMELWTNLNSPPDYQAFLANRSL